MALNALQLAEWIDEDVAKTISEKNIWNSAHRLTRFAAFYSKMEEYLHEGTHTDVNIIFQDRVFKCHRIVLAAASGYFHTMFRDGNFNGSPAQDVALQDIDSVTFGQILLYVYRGEIAAINDDSVFGLLRASQIFGLNEIEKFCVHYLTQKSIPMDCALEIYLFASTSHEVSLIRATSEFILQHLDRFSEESVFLKIPFENFSTLLTYFQPSSSTIIRERRLLNTILKWVCHSTGIHEERRSSYIELARKVDFRFLPATYVLEYFEWYSSVGSNDENNRSEASEGPSDSDSCMENNTSFLHVYARTELLEPGGPPRSQLSIITLQENDAEDINWHLTHHATNPSIDMVRIVESYGRLYSMKSCENRWIFSSSTAIDLMTDVRSLTTPPHLPSPDSFNYEDISYTRDTLCRLHKSIYYLDILHNFLRYDIELDVWSPTNIPLGSEVYAPLAAVSDDTRLYIIGENKFEADRTRNFVAYDPRAGKVDELPKIGLESSKARWSAGCYHKGRIYVNDYYFHDSEPQPKSSMAVYDVAAGRWDFEKMYSELTGHQLVSFNNRLFKFEFEPPNHIYSRIFDSYLRTWGGSSHNEKLLDVMERSESQHWSFMDAIVFQS